MEKKRCRVRVLTQSCKLGSDEILSGVSMGCSSPHAFELPPHCRVSFTPGVGGSHLPPVVGGYKKIVLSGLVSVASYPSLCRMLTAFEAGSFCRSSNTCTTHVHAPFLDEVVFGYTRATRMCMFYVSLLHPTLRIISSSDITRVSPPHLL